MVLPLMLVLGLSLGQAPDFLDVQPVGGDHQVLAGGGLVYRWSGRGQLVLEAQLGSPATALHTCDNRRSIAVGLEGQVHVSTSGLAWRPITLEGAKDLWAVAGAGCDRVLLGGEGGLWQGSLANEEPSFQRVPLPTQLPLYGVATERERAVAVGAGGTVLLRRFSARPFTQVTSGTEAPLLSVTLLGGERYVVGGAGGLWLGYADTLRQVYVDESEVFTRVVFADARVGVALGQRKVLVTTDGGESWRVQPRANLLSAVHLGAGRFLAVGSGGAWVVLDTAEPEEKSRKQPEPPAEKPSEVHAAPLPPIGLREPPPPADPKCLLQLDKQHVRAAQAFLDVKRVGREVLVVGSDGTVRRAEGNALPVVHQASGPLLGLGVSPDGREVAAVGYGVVERSSDGGWTFRSARAPSDSMFYAAAFAGDALLVFDGNGRGWRSVSGGPFEELSLPRTVAYVGAAFADARRGYVVGFCGTLLETLDGGVNWTVLRSPLKEGENLEGVLAWGDTLYVSGSGGVWRSEDRGRTFQQVLSTLTCVRLARSGDAVAAACGGGQGNVLRYASNGRDFQPVPVPYSHALMSVALLPGEELVAVGVREQFIRARPSGGSIAYGSKAIQEWKAFLDKVQRVKAQPARARPPRTVAVVPLHPE
jgi:photosystem II stability/assembly factor-like uncharacterized protein